MTRLASIALVAVFLSGCAGMNLFGPPKLKEQPIVPAATLYQGALDDMDRLYFQTAIKKLEQLERQHPRDPLTEKGKLMQVYANYRIGQFDEAILAADRYLALYPTGKDVPYVLWLKGTAYFAQIKDITRDQQLSRDAIDTYNVLISSHPKSEYAEDAREKLLVAYDQLAGKEMSVGRYYLGNGQYTAGINRFRTVVEQWQTSTHIEEALYRLTEATCCSASPPRRPRLPPCSGTTILERLVQARLRTPRQAGPRTQPQLGKLARELPQVGRGFNSVAILFRGAMMRPGSFSQGPMSGLAVDGGPERQKSQALRC